jgi:hypothetical protein
MLYLKELPGIKDEIFKRIGTDILSPEEIKFCDENFSEIVN